MTRRGRARPDQARPARSGQVTFEVVDDLAGEFAERLVEAFHSRPGQLFQLGLTGGACARRCYEQLAQHAETQIDWWLVDAWWVDELDLHLDEPDSHYGMARAVLFDVIGAAYALHPLAPDAAEAAALLPDRLDVVHLDLGPDGSLFSAGGRRLPEAVTERADVVLVTVAGSDRRDALRAVRAGENVPAARLVADRQVWLVERAAAG
ncbi:MAG: hypothetical protein GEV08_02810 [Acidimicrobiia bacterium]|nr:hypothetical protein [Acidimicrobiia bacterium]